MTHDARTFCADEAETLLASVFQVISFGIEHLLLSDDKHAMSS